MSGISDPINARLLHSRCGSLRFPKRGKCRSESNVHLFDDVIHPQGFLCFSAQAVKMTSTKTQLPYDYYDVAVHCKPLNGTKYKSENLGKINDDLQTPSRAFLRILGEILRGDRIVNTKFKVSALLKIGINHLYSDGLLGRNGQQRSLSNTVQRCSTLQRSKCHAWKTYSE